MRSLSPSLLGMRRLLPSPFVYNDIGSKVFGVEIISRRTTPLNQLLCAQPFKHRGTRHMSSQSNSIDRVMTILTEKKRFDKEVAQGIVGALESSFGKGKVDEKVLTSFGDAGVESLAKAVQVELSKKVSDFVGKVHFIVPHHNYSFDMEMPEGQSLMELSKTELGHEMLGEYLECACGGNMSCATCHVILDQKTYDSLKKPGRAEKDMLDLAYEPTETSRLGCQIRMKPERDGMTITIPSGVNNFWS